MNLTVSRTWKNSRNRYIVGVSGVALALSIAIGGISSLPNSGSREASVTPSSVSQPSTLYTTAADAVFAAQSGVAVSPQFANSVDAYEASIALAFNQPVAAANESLDTALGLGQPGERGITVAPQFANSVDAYEASIALAFNQPVAAANDSLDTALGLGQPGERSVVAPLFPSMVDADLASH
jgi:hypothetical protein